MKLIRIIAQIFTNYLWVFFKFLFYFDSASGTVLEIFTLAQFEINNRRHFSFMQYDYDRGNHSINNYRQYRYYKQQNRYNAIA